MRIIEEGHVYALKHLAKDSEEVLKFCKRSSDAIDYGPSEHDGTNTQEVMRAVIQRCRYLNAVIACDETQNAIYHARMVIYEFEARAFRRKMQKLNKREGVHEERGLTARRDGYEDVPFTEHFIEMRPVGEDGHLLLTEEEKAWVKARFEEQA